jgi:hypothetical protein
LCLTGSGILTTPASGIVRTFGVIGKVAAAGLATFATRLAGALGIVGEVSTRGLSTFASRFTGTRGILGKIASGGFTALAADLSHMLTIAAHRLATLAAGAGVTLRISMPSSSLACHIVNLLSAKSKTVLLPKRGFVVRDVQMRGEEQRGYFTSFTISPGESSLL